MPRNPAAKTTTATGRAAESAVADRMVAAGFTILARNWRDRRHEIDIVARRAGTTHFIEVKYRSRPSAAGAGYAYITPEKIRRLAAAAYAWRAAHRHTGLCRVDVVSATGDPANPSLEYFPNITASL